LIFASDRQCSDYLAFRIPFPGWQESHCPAFLKNMKIIVGSGWWPVCILQYIGKRFADGAQPMRFLASKRRLR
jgi:hypothetical protein